MKKDNYLVSKITAILSLICLLVFKDSYGYAAISILNRHSMMTILLLLLWIVSAFSKKMTMILLNLVIYIVLYSMLMYRIIVEMEGFVTFNIHLFNGFDYLLVGVSFILLVCTFYLHVRGMKK